MKSSFFLDSNSEVFFYLAGDEFCDVTKISVQEDFNEERVC